MNPWLTAAVQVTVAAVVPRLAAEPAQRINVQPGNCWGSASQPAASA